MKRRDFVQACGLAAALPAGIARAQAGRVRRIGYLGATTAAGATARVAALRRGFAKLGYVEGKNLVIETRFGGDSYERLAAMAGELAAAKVEVIVTHGTPGTRAAKQANSTIPVVMATVGDAVLAGFTTSLREPDGNVTGSTFFAAELAAKRLEVLRDLMPAIKRIAVLQNPANSSLGSVIKAMSEAAAALKLQLQPVEVRGPSDFDAAFDAMAKARAEALVIVEDAMLNGNLKAIADLALARRLPAIGLPEFAEAGALMAYGVDLVVLWERAAYFVDKLLKGAKVRELPIERATRFEMIVNNRTARALGITIPNLIALRADRVIE